MIATNSTPPHLIEGEGGVPALPAGGRLKYVCRSRPGPVPPPLGGKEARGHDIGFPPQISKMGAPFPLNQLDKPRTTVRFVRLDSLPDETGATTGCRPAFARAFGLLFADLRGGQDFRAKRPDRIKIIWLDSQGICLFSKRLGEGAVSLALDRRRRAMTDCTSARSEGTDCVGGLHVSKG